MRRGRVRGAAALILIGLVGGACAQPSGTPSVPSSAGPPRSGTPPASAGEEAGGASSGGPVPSAGPGRPPEPGTGASRSPGAGREPGPPPGHGPGRPDRPAGEAPRGPGAAPRADPGKGRTRDLPEHGPDRRAAPELRSRPARALAAYSRELRRAVARRAAAARHWGLARPPLSAPAPPPARPPLRTPPGLSRGDGLPPVVTRVPTRDRVVFLTVDDGTEQDPRLLDMLRDLKVPVSAFLTHGEVRTGYGYFRELRRLGAGVHNHAVTHRDLRTLPYEGQRAEICAQQHRLREEFGAVPRLFRPPYGGYDRDTLQAAASCGVRAVPLWSVEAFPDRMEFGAPDRRLRPGDIVLTHFRGPRQWNGTMPDVVRRVLRTATEQGFAVARIEDYL